MPEFRSYTDADHEECLELLEAAFAEDPQFRVFSAKSRAKYVRRVMQSVMSLLVPEREILVACDNDRIQGVMGLIPPGRYPYPALRSWRIFARLLVSLPPVAMLRMMWTSTLIDYYHPRARHWYLALLAVHPAVQRQRIGSQLMSIVLSKSDLDRLPVYLETTTEANVDYYSRFGFSVWARHKAGITPAFWAMYKAVEPETDN